MELPLGDRPRCSHIQPQLSNEYRIAAVASGFRQESATSPRSVAIDGAGDESCGAPATALTAVSVCPCRSGGSPEDTPRPPASRGVSIASTVAKEHDEARSIPTRTRSVLASSDVRSLTPGLDGAVVDQFSVALLAGPHKDEDGSLMPGATRTCHRSGCPPDRGVGRARPGTEPAGLPPVRSLHGQGRALSAGLGRRACRRRPVDPSRQQLPRAPGREGAGPARVSRAGHELALRQQRGGGRLGADRARRQDRRRVPQTAGRRPARRALRP